MVFSNMRALLNERKKALNTGDILEIEEFISKARTFF